MAAGREWLTVQNDGALWKLAGRNLAVKGWRLAEEREEDVLARDR